MKFIGIFEMIATVASIMRVTMRVVEVMVLLRIMFIIQNHIYIN